MVLALACGGGPGTVWTVPMLHDGCITPNFPRRRGWKTPLKEHWLYLQLVVLKMLLTMTWHRVKFPAPRWVKLTGAPRGARPATHGLA